MMDPIDELMAEHRTIEKVLEALRAAARQEVPLEFYEQAIDFIASYADKLHHGKEEERLFPLLEERGIPREGGPIGVMLQEHVMGRAHVQRMREHLAARDRVRLRQESLAYAALLEGHIMKEDGALYPMGRSVFAPGDVERLREAFDEVDPTGETAKRYEALAADLLTRVR